MALALDQTSIRNAALDLITTRAGASALLRIYTATRPATGAAITSQTLLATLTCNATFAPASSGGVLTLNAITSATAAATGTAAWFRLLKSDGTTFVMDGDVGTAGSDINFSTVSFVSGATIAISSFTITAGNP